MTLAQRIEQVQNEQAAARMMANDAERASYDDELSAFRQRYEDALLASIADVETCAYCGTPDGVTYHQRSDLYLCPSCRAVCTY